MCLLSFVAWLILLYMYIADLQLDVKGCCDVYASFDKYVEVECLEGDNKYQAEQYGLQVINTTVCSFIFLVCFVVVFKSSIYGLYVISNVS